MQSIPVGFSHCWLLRSWCHTYSFLTLSLWLYRVLSCSWFDLTLFLLLFLLFAWLQAASTCTSDLTQLLCGLFAERGGQAWLPRLPPKRLASSKDCESFVFSYITLQMRRKNKPWLQNQLICEVHDGDETRMPLQPVNHLHMWPNWTLGN